MPRESHIYRQFVHDATKTADLKTRRFVWSAFSQYLLPKVEKSLPAIVSRSEYHAHRLRLWDLGLNTLGTMIAQARMTDQTDRALGLSQLSVKASAYHLKELADDFNINGDKPLTGPLLDVALRAGHHLIVAVEDLRRAGLQPEELHGQERSLLTTATCLAERYQPQMLKLFEADGVNEINLYKDSVFQKMARSTRAYPG